VIEAFSPFFGPTPDTSNTSLADFNDIANGVAPFAFFG
jgi:hypothetical protein